MKIVEILLKIRGSNDYEKPRRDRGTQRKRGRKKGEREGERQKGKTKGRKDKEQY